MIKTAAADTAGIRVASKEHLAEAKQRHGQRLAAEVAVQLSVDLAQSLRRRERSTNNEHLTHDLHRRRAGPFCLTSERRVRNLHPRSRQSILPLRPNQLTINKLFCRKIITGQGSSPACYEEQKAPRHLMYMHAHGTWIWSVAGNRFLKGILWHTGKNSFSPSPINVSFLMWIFNGTEAESERGWHPVSARFDSLKSVQLSTRAQTLLGCFS